MEETTWRKSNHESNSLQEGFNLPGDDYFINVKRTISLKTQFGKLIEKIKKLLKKIPNPITKFDKGLESLLKSLLMLMIGQVDCKTGKLKSNRIAMPNTFTWASGQLDLLKQKSVSLGYDFKSGWNTTKQGSNDAVNTTSDALNTIVNGWKDKIEQFSMPDTPDLIYTIQSFLENHPKLNETAVTTYYLKKLNAYEKSLGIPPTSNQLFIFNNEFDNILSDPSVLGEIEAISNSIPKSSYPNTAEGFANYLKKTARFSFSNKTPISFYPFDTQYFPYPIDLAGFEQAIQNVNDPNYIQNINQYLSSLTKPADPPATPPELKDVDTNYAFSINLNGLRTESIQTYLKYISQWYGLLLYYKYKNNTVVLFPTIEANVCMVYITYLNAIEFQKYRVYSTYLTPYEIAMFNHLFFIFLMQDQIEFVFTNNNPNVYNLALPSDGIPTDYISKGTPTIYINILPQNIFSLIRMFVMEINNRIKYLSGSIVEDNYQPLPLDGTLILPPVPDDVIPPINVLLANYILGLFTPTDYNNTLLPENVVPAKDISNYYFPPGLSDCEKANNNMQNECKGYAKKIKAEIYRMCCVPIIVYIVYNFYYMFFFKDCFDLVKKTDEAGNMIYERKCMECFAPIFPDWELMYRSFEQRQTDFVFEFVFKPVKMVYTMLNAIKTFFRKGFFGYVIKDNVPYLFFLWTFFQVYRFFKKRSNLILQTLGTLSKLKIPDVQIMGRKALDGYAKGVTVYFFLFSFLNKFFGISISEIMECIYNAHIGKKAAREAAALATKLGEKQLADTGAEGALGKNNEFLDSMASNVKSSLFGKKITGGAPEEPGNSKSLMGDCKLQGSTYENSWVKWIMKTGDGPFTKLLKIFCAIIYWILKYSVSMGMVKFSKTIFALYFLINGVMGIGNYTTPLQSSSYKFDLIHRIIYTKLCSSNYRKEPFKYLAKCFIFVSIYFLLELVILDNLIKGIKNYSSMSSNTPAYNTGLSEKTNEDADKNSMAVKTFMVILNGMIVIMVLLWCVYKAVYKMPDFVRSYEEQDNPSIDKRLEYDCSKQPDAYEERTTNSVLKTFMKSDDYNKTFTEQFETRTAGMKKPSILSGFVSKMGEYSKQLNDKFTQLGEKAYEYKGKASESVFGKKNDEPDITNLASGSLNDITTNPVGSEQSNSLNDITTNPVGSEQSNSLNDITTNPVGSEQSNNPFVSKVMNKIDNPGLNQAMKKAMNNPNISDNINRALQNPFVNKIANKVIESPFVNKIANRFLKNDNVQNYLKQF